MRKKKVMKKYFGLDLIIFLLVFSLISAPFLYTTSKYWIDIISKTTEKKELDQKLYELKEEEKALTVDVKKLQDPDYIARYAREKFLYSKDEEFIIRIPDLE